MLEEGLPLVGFRDCDIRGVFGNEISLELAYRLGRAIGSVARDGKAAIGGDFRQSTPELLDALKRGLMESGTHVFDLGQLTTPAYYFGKHHLGVKTGVMVTASHNPAAWNGFKPVIGDKPITPDELDHLKARIISGEFTAKQGSAESVDIKGEYVSWLARRFAGLGGALPEVVFDCGNGATGWVMREVVDALGLRAHLMFEQPDGTFPNRSSDISRPGDLAALEAEVVARGAAAGFGFDGDGDRVGVVDEQGQRVSSDRLIAWLAEQLLRRERGGSVIYDVKLSRLVADTVERNGGTAVVQKSGHTFIKTAMLEHNALLGGEYSGHIFYRELHGGDDGLFSALLVGSLLAESGESLSGALGHLSEYFSTPDVRVKFEGEKSAVLAAATDHARAQGANLILLDGVRAEYANGWALMRASVTEPAFTFRFEGDTKEHMLAVAEAFLVGVPDLGEGVWAQVQRFAGV